MTITSSHFLLTAGILYGISLIIYLVYLKQEAERLVQAGLILLLAGFLTHSVSLINRAIEIGHLPITTMFESISFFAWAIVLVCLVMSLTYRTKILNAFVIPVIIVLVFGAFFSSRKIVPLKPVLQSYWFGLHTFFAFLGYAAFTIAFISGIMYLLQERQLKSRKPGCALHQLPSLNILDLMNYRCIIGGFLFLTIGIATGYFWARQAAVPWGNDPKVIWSFATWMVYLILLHIRRTSAMRGRKVAFLSIIGFLMIIVTFLGVNIFSKGLHASFR